MLDSGRFFCLLVGLMYETHAHNCSARSVVERSIAGSAPVPPEPLRLGPGTVPVDPLVFPLLFLEEFDVELKIEAGAAFVVKLQETTGNHRKLPETTA